MKKVNIKDKFDLFSDLWKPKVVGELNESYVKVVKVKGEFDWHYHSDGDELFYIIKGALKIKFDDDEVILKNGDMFVVPKATEHCIVADDEVHLMLITPKCFTSMGNLNPEIVRDDVDRI